MILHTNHHFWCDWIFTQQEGADNEAQSLLHVLMTLCYTLQIDSTTIYEQIEDSICNWIKIETKLDLNKIDNRNKTLIKLAKIYHQGKDILKSL